ncbi:type II secretion system protein GspD [Massilia sp. 9096]|uniref:type II secretion system protein GspD n=1 Tax=Massilia sp. 9096 TaxID=1500894 RepID=UPI00055C14A1|nr:secretin N-terminal domain-containing protein [Massilia sp. 9096]
MKVWRTLLAGCLLAPAAHGAGADAVQSVAQAAAAPAVAVAVATAPAAATAAAADTMSYTFRDTPIAELFNMLSRTGHVNIVLARGVAGNVSINLYDLTVRQAIEAVAEAGGYVVTERAGGFFIADPKAIQKDSAAPGQQVRSLKVRYIDLKKAGEILARQLGPGGTVTTLDQSRTLVVEANEAGLARAAGVLREIDRPPQQILIEAKILEITLNQDENFGVDWNRIVHSDGPVTVGATGLAASTGPRFFANVITNSLEAHLTALSNKGRVHTLATPRLLALEDQEATTNVGDEIGYKLTTTINNVTTESIQFLQTGVILRVTPSIDVDGRILMRVHPEVSSGSIASGIPSKNTTEVSTQLVAADGQAVLIGGLLKASSNYQRQGVPLLSDIPLVGRVFSNTADTGASTETIVVITPHIVPAGSALIDAASAQKVEQSERVLGLRNDVLDRKIELIAPPRTESVR